MKPELIDLVDINNNIIGTTNAVTAHEQKQIHRVVGVLLFDSEGNLYLQSGNKYNKYDLSVGGHVRKGETYDSAAKREMREELGIDVKLIHIGTFLPENAKLGHFWAIYKGEVPSDWIFRSTEEVESVIKINIKEVNDKISSSPELFTNGFVNVFNEFMKVF